MSLETEVRALLELRCDNVFSVVAPSGTPVPRLVYQHAGGKTLRFYDNSAPDKRNVLLVVSAWATTKKAAFDLIRQIEADLCASSALQVTPQGEPMDGVPDGEAIYGAVQTFSVWGSRT